MACGIELLTVPIPSMANRTVAKNSGMWPTDAIHGRDPISGRGTDVDVPSPANGLAPVTTHDMVQPNPTSMNAVAMAEKGTKRRSVRMMPSGTRGMARPRIQARTGKCHSTGVCVSATCEHLTSKSNKWVRRTHKIIRIKKNHVFCYMCSLSLDVTYLLERCCDKHDVNSVAEVVRTKQGCVDEFPLFQIDQKQKQMWKTR